MTKTIRILGTRGVPAAHGGFLNTFAEYLALYLVKNGWRVIVYCQLDGEGPITEDLWEGVERVNIPVPQAGARGLSSLTGSPLVMPPSIRISV